MPTFAICQFCNGAIKSWVKDGHNDGWVHLEAADFWRCPELRGEPTVAPPKAKNGFAVSPYKLDKLMRQTPA